MPIDRVRALRTLAWLTAVNLVTATVVGVDVGLPFGHRPLWLHVAALVGVGLVPAQVVTVRGVWRASNTTERERLALATRSQAVERTSGEWVWTLDADGVIVDTAGVSGELLGYGPAELAGRRALDLLHPADVDRVVAAVTDFARRDGWRNFPMRFVDRDGRDRWLDTGGVPIRDAAGRLVGMTGTARLAAVSSRQRIATELTRDRILGVLRPGDAIATAFQPIVDLLSARVVGVEALSRFVDHRHATETWFRDAASVGLGADLELRAMAGALAAIPRLPEHLYASVNLSPTVVADPRVPMLIERSGLPASRIVIEITEHQAIEDYETFGAVLSGLRRAGCRLAVDDAGAGFASFRHILRIRPEIIKLDRGVVAGIDRDLARRALAASVVTFALELNAFVVAEGVETEAELEALAVLGLDGVQGYLDGRPTAREDDWARWADPVVLPR